MRPATEILIGLAALAVTGYFGWQLAAQTVVAQIQANQRAAQFEQAFQACVGRGEK